MAIDTFWMDPRYYNEVGAVMATKYTINLQGSGLEGAAQSVQFAASGAANVGLIPKGIGYSNTNVLEGGRVFYRWANQAGSGYKAYSLSAVGPTSALISIGGAALGGVTLGETIDSYYYGYIQYQRKYGNN